MEMRCSVLLMPSEVGDRLANVKPVRPDEGRWTGPNALLAGLFRLFASGVTKRAIRLLPVRFSVAFAD
jgi:hypothetical protein